MPQPILQRLKHQFRPRAPHLRLLRIFSTGLFIFSLTWSGLALTRGGRDVPSTATLSAIADAITTTPLVSGATNLLADANKAVTDTSAASAAIADFATASLWSGFITTIDSVVNAVNWYATSFWGAVTTAVDSLVTTGEDIATNFFPPAASTTVYVDGSTASPTRSQLLLAVEDYFQQGLPPELLALLKGPKGDTGPAGARGITTHSTSSGGGGTVSVPSDLSLQTLIVAGQTSLVATSVSANFEAVGYASASAFRGSAFSAIVSNCNTEAQTLLWDSATGTFSCGADEGGGGSAALIEVRESSASDGTSVSSLSFNAGGFDVSFIGTEAVIKIDYANGPASRSIAQNITGAWSFSGGASSSTGFEITTGNLGINAGPVTSARLEVGGTASISGQTLLALSTGNVGVGTATPKAKLSLVDTGAGTVSSSSFSIRSSFVTGSVASISASALTTGNALRIEANALTTGFGINLRSTGTITTGAMLNIMNNTMQTGSVASISGTGVTSGNLLKLTGGVTTGSGILANINGLTTGFGINLRSTGTITTGAMLNIMNNTMTTGSIASISATALTGGGRVFNITVPASTSLNNPAGIMLVKDVNNLTVVSLSMGGTLALRGRIYTHAGGVATCTAVNTPNSGCLDYAESYPSVDGLNPGDVVAWDSTIERVIKATAADVVIGVISSNPAVLVTGTEVRTGAAANEKIPGKSSVALAGHVPVKVSLENGPILPGDHVAPSLTQPGYGVKAVNAGVTIGTALSGTGAASEGVLVDVFVNVGYWIPDDAIESLTSGIQVGTDSDGNLLINRTGLASTTTLVKFDTQGNAVFTGSITATRIEGQPEGLAPIINQIALLSAQIEALKTSPAPITVPVALLDMPQVVASMSAQLESQSMRLGMLTEFVSSLQKPLDLAILASQSQALTFNGVITAAGGLRVDTIRSTGDAINFMDDVVFFGRPYFTRDTGGFATVGVGHTEVDVAFDREFIYQPVVNATIVIAATSASYDLENQILNGDVRFVVTRRSANGFTIKLNKPAGTDIPFSWTALAVQQPRTFTLSSESPVTPPKIVLPLVTLVPPPADGPTASPSENDTLSPVASGSVDETLTPTSGTLSQ